MSTQPYTLGFTAETTIYQNEVRCHISENDFNYTQNPTALSGSAYSSEATATITVNSVGVPNTLIEVFVIDPILGSILIASYTVTPTDTTTDITAASLAAAINSSTQGYLAVVNSSTVTVIARPNIGSSINGNNLVVNVYNAAQPQPPTSPPIPTINTPSPATLTGFTYVQGSGPSAVQNLVIVTSNLGNGLVITAPPNFEISTSPSSGFGSSITLPSTTSGTTVYVRVVAGLLASTYTGTITFTSIGAVSQTAALSGTVTPLPSGARVWDSTFDINFT